VNQKHPLAHWLNSCLAILTRCSIDISNIRNSHLAFDQFALATLAAKGDGQLSGVPGAYSVWIFDEVKSASKRDIFSADSGGWKNRRSLGGLIDFKATIIIKHRCRR
jgi:hypothetical protein